MAPKASGSIPDDVQRMLDFAADVIEPFGCHPEPCQAGRTSGLGDTRYISGFAQHGQKEKVPYPGTPQQAQARLQTARSPQCRSRMQQRWSGKSPPGVYCT